MTPFQAESQRARSAQKEWSARSLRHRLKPVRQLHDLIMERIDAITTLIAEEIPRDRSEILATEITPTLSALRFLVQQAERILAPRPISLWQRPLWLIGCRDAVHRRPYGVIGLIGTWNYPLFINFVPMVQALVAGNAVLWKPSERMPRTAALFTTMFHDAGFPPDLIITLPATREAGPALAEAEIDFLHFTGSHQIGRILARRLGERLIPSVLELSGVDAVVILPDADVAMAARSAWYAATLNQGRTCMASRRVFVHRQVYAQFQQEIQLLKSTCRLVCECIDPATADQAECLEPSFRPLLAVIPFDDREQVIAMFHRGEYALSTSIFSADKKSATEWAACFRSGTVIINDVILSAAHPATPFGGRGASGWGVSQGVEGLLTMTVPQHVSVRSGSQRIHLQASLDQNPQAEEVIRGSLAFRHGLTWRSRWRGFWQLLRGLRKLP